MKKLKMLIVKIFSLFSSNKLKVSKVVMLGDRYKYRIALPPAYVDDGFYRVQQKYNDVWAGVGGLFESYDEAVSYLNSIKKNRDIVEFHYFK